ncbi:MAG: PKD domain-containing protein [Saprospiraceae bacterium]|nr:PKD domain-containing protein [Saprospiraceae bacterium]
MKTVVLILTILACLSDSLYGQMFDNVWVMGYNWDSDPEAETYRLNFDTFPPQVEIAPGEVRIWDAYAGICDSAGRLILYTNNCSIADGNGEIISNGDSMTFGWELDWCNDYLFHPYEMQNIILPSTKERNKYLFVNKSTYKSAGIPLIIYQNKINYSIVQNQDSKNIYNVTQKNNLILEGRFSYGELTAVKHGNGRDWWLPIPDETGNSIYLVLCEKDSFYLHSTQSLGPEWANSGSFQASFSPDGAKYVRYNRYYGLYLYDFDRCSGQFSNVQFFSITSTTQGIKSGACFSPDNSKIYYADYDSLYQLDVLMPDILMSKQLVAVYDGYVSGIIGTKFSRIVHGADGRLYVIPPGSTSAMHIINRPNLKGVACDVQQHKLEFPNPYLNPPTHPHYRLGPLDGSACDTLGIDNLPLAGFRPEASDTSSLAWHFWDISSYQPTQWYWDFGDGGAASQEISPTHQFSAPGLYTVCLTVSNAYGADSHCKVVEVKTVGAGEAPEEGVIRVIPNPTTGELSISGINASGCMVEVFDLSGKSVHTGEMRDNNLSLSHLQTGWYVIRLIHPQKGSVGISKVAILK